MPVAVRYGIATFPEMATAADSLAAAIPGATQAAIPGAMHQLGTGTHGRRARPLRARAALTGGCPGSGRAHP